MTTAAVVVKDEWVTAAMTNDEMVVGLLLRLKKAQDAAHMVEMADKMVSMSFRWGLRQRRSRTSRCGGGSLLRKEADSVRGSPMTPLFWSGGSGSDGSTSPSAATVGGFEETSRQATCSTSTGSRSKVFASDEITSASSKISKRKKTYSELRGEESVLLKERLLLKKEIATLRATFKEQTTRNENLKRIKLDLKSDGTSNLIPDDLVKEKSDQTHKRLPSSHDQISSSKHSSFNNYQHSDSSKTDISASSNGGLFLIPDLNMTPSEADSGTDTLYGTS